MAEIEVEAPDGTIISGPTEEAALAGMRKYLASQRPDGADLEGVVSDLPGGGFETPNVGPYKTLAELPAGMAKSLGRNVLGALKLNPVSLTAKAMGGPDPTGELLESGREALAPTTVGEEKAADIEKLLEFFIPGPGKAAGVLGNVAKGALEGGLIGSAQAGEPSPEAAAGGAVGGGLAGVTGKVLGSIISKLPERAVKALTRLAKPGVGFEQEKVSRAARAMLEEGGVGGGPEALTEQTAARAAKLTGPRDAYRAATDAAPIDPTTLAQPLVQEAQQYVRRSPDGQIFFTNKLKFDQLMAQAKEIMAARGKVKVGPVKAKLGDMEDLLQGQAESGKVYERADPTKAAAEEGVRLMRQGLNTASPGREPVMRPLSDAVAMKEAMAQAMGRAELREPGQAGQQFATRGVISTAISGGAGAAAAGGAEAAVQIGRFLQSPTFRSKSAQAQWDIAKTLIELRPELEQLIRSSLSATGAQEHQNEPTGLRAVLQQLNLKTPEEPR